MSAAKLKAWMKGSHANGITSSAKEPVKRFFFFCLLNRTVRKNRAYHYWSENRCNRFLTRERVNLSLSGSAWCSSSVLSSQQFSQCTAWVNELLRDIGSFWLRGSVSHVKKVNSLSKLWINQGRSLWGGWGVGNPPNIQIHHLQPPQYFNMKITVDQICRIHLFCNNNFVPNQIWVCHNKSDKKYSPSIEPIGNAQPMSRTFTKTTRVVFEWESTRVTLAPKMKRSAAQRTIFNCWSESDAKK